MEQAEATAKRPAWIHQQAPRPKGCEQKRGSTLPESICVMAGLEPARMAIWGFSRLLCAFRISTDWPLKVMNCKLGSLVAATSHVRPTALTTDAPAHCKKVNQARTFLIVTPGSSGLMQNIRRPTTTGGTTSFGLNKT